VKVVIFGATGPTGREIVARALERGHEVTAFVRNPEASGFEKEEGFRIFAGDVLQPATVDRVMRDQQAVVCAVGPRAHTGQGETPTNVCSVATRHILESMEKSGTKRFVVLSSVGVGDSRGKMQAGLVLGLLREKLIVPLVSKREFADKEVQEQLVRKSRVDWVIVRPTSLTTGEARGQFKVALDGERVGARIARADVAAFMVDQITNNEYVGKAPVIGG
jgi:putative NADH-flavin reductase